MPSVTVAEHRAITISLSFASFCPTVSYISLQVAPQAIFIEILWKSSLTNSTGHKNFLQYYKYPVIKSLLLSTIKFRYLPIIPPLINFLDYRSLGFLF